jgi:hypothetical protein
MVHNLMLVQVDWEVLLLASLWFTWLNEVMINIKELSSFKNLI